MEDPVSPHHQLQRASQTETFISEVISLLSNDNEAIGMNIRETVKELASYELSPQVYPYFFRSMSVEFAQIFSLEGPHIQESHTALIEQLLSVVQHILENKVEGALEHLVHVKMDEVVIRLVQYVHNLLHGERSLTLKIKTSHLIETLMQRSRELSFHHEVHFRNQLAEYLTSWVSGEVCVLENCSHGQNLQNELDLCAMRAMGPVLQGLVLQPKDMAADIIEEKGKLFQRYFSSFMGMIHSLNTIEWSRLVSIHKHGLIRQVTSLREATIQAMSNMLTANIDSGLTHAISLGYHEDLQTRASFIEVLTSILKQGAEFNSLADTFLADRYNQMMELVTTQVDDGGFPVMMALINSVPPEHLEDLAEVLVVLFDYKNMLADFLFCILQSEVEAIESGRQDTLFRGNSIACKVLSCSFKTFGVYYLQSVVRPLILSLIKSHDLEYEVDPSRLDDPRKLERNQSNLIELVKSFYSTITNSLPSLPLQLRTVCHVLFSVVGSQSHEEGFVLDTVSSTVFLRFINPAIVSPQSYNLIQVDIPQSVHRGLTFISKVLQNLANHVVFRKEAHMMVFNQFLQQNFECSRVFALQMASAGPYREGEAVECIPFLKEVYKYRLHSLLWNNQERIRSHAASTISSVTNRHLFLELNTLLAQLGAPNLRRRRGSMRARSTMVTSQLEEFLDSMANECDEQTLRSIKAKEIFYQGGTSKAGNPVYYFISRKFRGDLLHVSYQILYHMMSLLKSSVGKSFELVIDLTGSTQMNEPDLELLVKFAAYVPELVPSHIEVLYFYNCSSAFRQYAAKLASAIRIFSHIKGAKHVAIVDKLSKFYEFIDQSELRLPQSTHQFETGAKEFPRVHVMVQKVVTYQIPATILVSRSGLVISETDKVSIFDIPTTLKDIHHVSDIREVFVEGKEGLVVRLVEGQLLKFSCPDAEPIFKELNSAISTWQNQQPSRFMSERKLEPKDVPGTFLNLALLNLGSTEPALRMAAYKLLCAVKKTFQLQIDCHLESSNELCIPMNSAQFVLAVSSQLARNESHLTLEFLSEVVAGFQRYTPALKQLCLSYISPWLPNLTRFVSEENAIEREKVSKLISFLILLTVAEEQMYPLIQLHIWSNMCTDPLLLRVVLDNFIKIGISEGLNSRKLEVLADTAVTLAQDEDSLVADAIVKIILKTIAHTSEKPQQCLEQHVLWSELVVLSRFLLSLSFNNKINVLKHLPDIFYICVLLMVHGPTIVRASCHGILLNTVQSLATLPSVMNCEQANKEISLKLIELSQPKIYMQFGFQDPPSVASYHHTSHHSGEAGRDQISSAVVVMVTEQLLGVVNACKNLFSGCCWLERWQKLARRTSFFHNPALQNRSFLMLGVVCDHASSGLVMRVLRALEEAVEKREDDIQLLEAIVICLTKMAALLDKNRSDLIQHLFWVSIGILQLEEATLYSAGVSLMEACIKSLDQCGVFDERTLQEVMQPREEALEWALGQMDRGVGISFSSEFNFAVAALLYKGFSHPLSTVRTRTQELLTTLLLIHSPDRGKSTLELTTNNLAYITALFPKNELLREQLRDGRPRLMSLVSSLIDQGEDPASYSTLLSTHTIRSHKTQALFLLMLASALVHTMQTHDEQNIQFLYEFLANACSVYQEVFPLIHSVIEEHMTLMLQQSQSPSVVKAIQQLVHVSMSRDATAALKPSYISDIGFGGLPEFFKPFPKNGLVYPTSQGPLFCCYLKALVQKLSPARSPSQGMFRSISAVGSLSSAGSKASPVLVHVESDQTLQPPVGNSLSLDDSLQDDVIGETNL